MKRTEKLVKSAGCLWGCLGFYRGHQYYNKQYMKEVEWNEKKQYYYITDFAHCVAGTCFSLARVPAIAAEASRAAARGARGRWGP